MREIPILFSTPMVQAILDGRKTMTRRVIKPQPTMNFVGKLLTNLGYPASHGWMWAGFGNPEDPSYWKCPYGQPGDRLWVRETWWNGNLIDDGNIIEKDIYLYKADEPSIPGWPDETYKWKPSIHMPKTAARIWLEVTDVRVERLQEISEEDAIAEGVEYQGGVWRDYQLKTLNGCLTARESFQSLWDSINTSRGYSWEENNWLWVVSFRRVQP